MNLNRGDIVVYKPVIEREGRSNLRLIVSADVINSNDALPTVFGLHVVTEDPGGLLAARIGEHGWAFVMELDRPLRARLTEKIGEATPDEMESVEQALRAIFDL